MTDLRTQFLEGRRPDDVAIFLADSAVDDLGKLERFGERVEGGVLLVVDGERGRNAFRAATGMDAMAFAKEAMALEGSIDSDLAGGTCPEAAESGDNDSDGQDGDEHEVRFVFAFAEERNEDVGGIYAEGDVIHAYAQCVCGTAYSDRWVVAE